VTDPTPVTAASGSGSLAYQRVHELLGYVERRIRDGETVIYLTCPKCKTRGEIDEDQLHGRVSVICSGCDFHETRNWFRSALTTAWDWTVPK